MTMSVMPVMDLIFSGSSMPLNRSTEPFGRVIWKSERLTAAGQPQAVSRSRNSWNTEWRSVAPTLRTTSTLRRRLSALSSTFWQAP